MAPPGSWPVRSRPQLWTASADPDSDSSRTGRIPPAGCSHRWVPIRLRRRTPTPSARPRLCMSRSPTCRTKHSPAYRRSGRGRRRRPRCRSSRGPARPPGLPLGAGRPASSSRDTHRRSDSPALPSRLWKSASRRREADRPACRAGVSSQRSRAGVRARVRLGAMPCRQVSAPGRRPRAVPGTT